MSTGTGIAIAGLLIAASNILAAWIIVKSNGKKEEGAQ